MISYTSNITLFSLRYSTNFDHFHSPQLLYHIPAKNWGSGNRFKLILVVKFSYRNPKIEDLSYFVFNS